MLQLPVTPMIITSTQLFYIISDLLSLCIITFVQILFTLLSNRMEQSGSYTTHPSRFWNKFILFAQYLLVGTTINITFTMAYTYKQLPSYNIVAFFSLISLIPSFKFLVSPLIQNHTSLSYGKRKTWMMICTVAIAVLLFISSYFTGDHQQIQIGYLFVLEKVFLGMNETSIDALGLKQYKERSKMSFLQSTVYRAGGVFGGLVFLKLISNTFCLHFGRSTPFLTVTQYFRIISLSYLVIAILSHFLYQQQQQEKQEIIMHKNYCDLVSQYKIFLDLNSSYCRLIVLYFLINLGLSSFFAGYRYVLIKQYGYNREDFVTIMTCMLFAIMPLSYYFSRHFGYDKLGSMYQYILLGRTVSEFIGFIFKFNTTLPLIFFYFFDEGFREMENIIVNTITNDMSSVALSGMFLSAASGLRKGIMNHAWSLKLVDIFGFELCCAVGFIQQIGIIYCVPRLLGWVETGEKPVDIREEDGDEYNEEETAKDHIK